MRKFTSLTKSLLVAAALLVGGASHAWAETGDIIYSNDFSTNDQTDFATWTAQSKKPSGYSYAQIGRAGSFSIDTGSLVHTPSVGKANSNVWNANVGIFNEAITAATRSKNYVMEFDVTLAITNHIACKDFIEFSDESKKVVLCLYADHTRQNSASGTTTYGYIVGGDNGFQVVEAGATGSINAEGTIGNGTQVPITDAISGMTGSKTYHVKLEAKVSDGTARLTITEGETTVVDRVSVNITANSGLKYICFEGYNSWETVSTSTTFDNFTIVEGETQTASYTINYKNGEAIVKTVSDEDVAIGTTINIESSFFKDDVKYITDEGQISSFTVAEGSNVYDIEVSVAQTYSYTVNATDGADILKVLATGSTYEGEQVLVTYPKYVNKNGTLYTKDATAKEYRLNVAITEDEQVINYVYTSTDITNVLYYSEAEEITGATATNAGNNMAVRSSNAQCGYAESDLTLISLPAGKYKMSGVMYSNSSAGCTLYFKLGEEEYNPTVSGASNWSAFSQEFTLASAADVKWLTSGNSKNGLDLVYIQKTADLPATENIVVTSAGFATYVSDYNLDFTSATTKAYKVSVADKGVATLDEVAKVPAKTPVLLYVEGGNGEGENITVTTDAVDAVTGNDLVAGTGATVETIDGEYTNMILNNVGGNIGFYFAAGQTVAANRAYLHFATSLAPEASSRMVMVFGEETTGISDTTRLNNKEEITNIYNLSGQRVAQPTKGLYIVNGKKVIIK
jgi:hypothetical protein